MKTCLYTTASMHRYPLFPCPPPYTNTCIINTSITSDGLVKKLMMTIDFYNAFSHSVLCIYLFSV